MNCYQINGQEVLVITPQQNIVYSSAEYFKVKVFSQVLLHRATSLVILKGDAINMIDATAANVNYSTKSN